MIGKEETKQKKLKKFENLTSLLDKKNQHTKKFLIPSRMYLTHF